MIKSRTLLASVAMIGILAGLMIEPAFASSNPASNNGIAVSPAIITLHIAPGQNSTSFNETVTNISDNILAVDISIKDFGALNAYGSIGFYGSKYNAADNPHSLSSAIMVPTNEYLLEPRSSQVIPIDVSNINSLAPGGHYSAILFTPVVARSSNGTNQVSLQPAVASLVFLATSSGGTASLKLGGLSFPDFSFSLTQTAYVLLSNTGNTQVIPRGYLTLKDPLSKVVSQSVLNANSGYILPSTSRLFSVTLNTSEDFLKLAGVYHLTLKYQVNGASSYQSTTKSFFYLNPFIFVYIGIIALIVLSVRQLVKKSKPVTKYKHRSKIS